MERWLDELARAAAGGRLTRRTILRRLLPGAVAGAVGLRLSRSSTVQAACPPGQTACGLACFDLSSNPQSCGACFHACGFGQVCTQGVCLMPGGCPPEQVLCAGRCTDLNSSAANCGACGRACPAGQVCRSGSCAATTTGCTGDQISCNGSCTSLSSDPHNCGACGHACPPGAPLCSGGMCAATCAPAYTACGGRCVNLLSDPVNCGVCGHACPSGICRNGVCSGQAQGTLCSTGSQCLSTFCAGGVCCSSACNQGCGSCAGGTCAPLAAGTVCTTNPAFICAGGSTACPTSCTSDAQCNQAGGFSCDTASGVCVANGSIAEGGACSATAQCHSGICTTGHVCCTPESASAACVGKVCGSVTNNCGQQVSCGTCTVAGDVCCRGQCFASACESGLVFNLATCTCTLTCGAGSICSSSRRVCGPGVFSTCNCIPAADGTATCVGGCAGGFCFGTCRQNSDCLIGWACFGEVIGGAFVGLCAPACNTQPCPP